MSNKAHGMPYEIRMHKQIEKGVIFDKTLNWAIYARNSKDCSGKLQENYGKIMHQSMTICA